MLLGPDRKKCKGRRGVGKTWVRSNKNKEGGKIRNRGRGFKKGAREKLGGPSKYGRKKLGTKGVIGSQRKV